MKRYVQTLDLKTDATLIAAYQRAHSREEMWQEIMDGIRTVGILEMEIYLLDNRLVMIVDTPDDFEWDTAMARLATLPRQAEWEAYVGKFQQAVAGAASNEKWRLMDKIFYLYK